MGTQVPRYMLEFHRPKLSTGPLVRVSQLQGELWFQLLTSI